MSRLKQQAGARSHGRVSCSSGTSAGRGVAGHWIPGRAAATAEESGWPWSAASQRVVAGGAYGPAGVVANSIGRSGGARKLDDWRGYEERALLVRSSALWSRPERDAEGCDDLGRARVTMQTQAPARSTGAPHREQSLALHRAMITASASDARERGEPPLSRALPLRRDSPECAHAQARETRVPRGSVQMRAA